MPDLCNMPLKILPKQPITPQAGGRAMQVIIAGTLKQVVGVGIKLLQSADKRQSDRPSESKVRPGNQKRNRKL